MTNISTEIAALLKDEPEGLTVAEIAQFFPDRSTSNISAYLSVLYAGGGYRRETAGGPAFRYFAEEGAVGVGIRRRNPKKPTTCTLQFRLDEALAKVEELAAWQTMALCRYPDLAVSPAVLKARQLLARRMPDRAADLLAGRYDDKPLVLAVVEALETGV